MGSAWRESRGCGSDFFSMKNLDLIWTIRHCPSEKTQLRIRSAWAMVHSALLGLLLLLILPPTKAQIAKKACTCNGYINARGQGECRTAYKGSIFCFVDDNDCEDGIKCNFKYPGKPRLVYSYLACTNYQFKPCKTKTGKRCHFPFYYKGERYSECTTTIFDPDENAKEFKDLEKECKCEDVDQSNEGDEGRYRLTGLAGLAGKG